MGTASPSAASALLPSNVYLWLGMGLPTLGFVLGIVQYFWARQLFTPWYLPVLTSVGVVFLLLAMLRAPSFGRAIPLVLFALLAAGQWYLLVGFSVLPQYHGPVAIGKPFPAFIASRADGTPFTADDLRGQDAVLVFFRGRW